MIMTPVDAVVVGSIGNMPIAPTIAPEGES
jgi:hypothetical protein